MSIKSTPRNRRQPRISHIDICQLFADQPFDDTFADRELTEANTKSPKRATFKATKIPIQLVRQLRQISRSPEPKHITLECVDREKRDLQDLPMIRSTRLTVPNTRNCQSNQPRLRPGQGTRTNGRQQGIRQQTDFTNIHMLSPKRRGIVDSYRAVSIQLNPRQRPLVCQSIFAKKNKLFGRKDLAHFSKTTRADSSFSHRNYLVPSAQPIDSNVRPWQSTEVEEMYI